MICLISDRRRLAGGAATLEHSRSCLVAQARFAADAGIDLVQIRERDLEAADLASIVRAAVAATRGTATRVVVNDRLDVAIACGADGVHLRGDSIGISAARSIAPRGFMVGRSVHSVDDATRATDADYLIAGTVFRSASKSDAHPLIGIDGLRAIAESVRVPILAIGGITETNVQAVARTGASGCAAIGMFMDADAVGDAPCRAIALRSVVEAARRRFDSVKTTP